MSRPWMPLYVADYLKDTAHLGALESGGYLHLIMHYWANGALPDNDKKLSRIARMTSKEWAANRPTLQEFFHDGWKHKRIDAEIETAQIKYEKRAKAGSEGGKATAAAKQNPSIAAAMLHQPQSQPPSVPKGTGAGAPSADPKTDLFNRAKQILGPKSGGSLTAKLLRSIGNEDDPRVIAKARARIEEASTKSKPAEWIGRCMSRPNGQLALTPEGEPYPEGII